VSLNITSNTTVNAQKLKCPEKRVAAARRRLIELGYIKPTRRRSTFPTSRTAHWASARRHDTDGMRLEIEAPGRSPVALIVLAEASTFLTEVACH
jgi:hypothetical protein